MTKIEKAVAGVTYDALTCAPAAHPASIIIARSIIACIARASALWAASLGRLHENRASARPLATSATSVIIHSSLAAGTLRAGVTAPIFTPSIAGD